MAAVVAGIVALVFIAAFLSRHSEPVAVESGAAGVHVYDKFLAQRIDELRDVLLLYTRPPFWQAIRTMCKESRCVFPFPNNDNLYAGKLTDVSWYPESKCGDADAARPEDIPPYLNLIWLALQNDTKEAKRLDELITDEDTRFQLSIYRYKRGEAYATYKKLQQWREQVNREKADD